MLFRFSENADQHVPAEIALDDGRMWKNVVTPAKSKVAETLDEFLKRVVDKAARIRVGATILVEPFDVPPTRSAVIRDPAGAELTVSAFNPG